VELKASDLRVNVHRAAVAGAVSHVQVTHMPSGMVEADTDASTLKARERCIERLRERLVEQFTRP
jgi:protein subunit release factor A